ncbi:MAG: phosphate ABC transporter substrate-binding protein PstS family protein [Peptococcaceae bacterium]
MFSGKKVMSIFIFTFVMIFSLSSVCLAAEGIKIKVDNTDISSDVAPVVENGHTLVPAAAIFKALGGKVTYDAQTRAVNITGAGTNIQIVVDSKYPSVNSQQKVLEVPAKIINGRTMVPLRFVAEAFGAKVDYNAATNYVIVKYFTDLTGTLKIGGSTTIQPVAEACAAELMDLNTNFSATIAGTGSGDGVKGAGTGQYNIGNASRAVEDSEKAEYRDLVDFTIGKDAIAVAVNPANPVSALNKQQVYDIFTGAVTNWADVGGNNAPIFVQTREEGSGTLGAFEELAIDTMGDGAITATAAPHPSNGVVKEALAQDENAIGFISLGYVDNTVKALKIEGIEATTDNALDGSYPYVRPLTVCTKGQPGGLAAKFINFYTSPMGKEIMSAENYIPIP